MKLKKPVTLLLMFLATAVVSINLFSPSFFRKNSGMLSFGKNDSYEKLWKRVDSCSNKGLPESALQVVQVIYDKAKAENNSPQFVKAIIHRMKFEASKEEFSLEKSITSLRDEVAAAKYPVKPVLQSILADAYWQYYQNNRWKFYERSETPTVRNNDISTWDLKAITKATIGNYKASLDNADSLKRTSASLYDEILTKGTADGRQWRPTLYDFLAHRAVDFFMNSEADVSRAASRFNVNEDVYLKTYPEFLNANLNQVSDSLETKYYALKVMMDLTRFHRDDKAPEALIDVELKRLDYVYQSSQNPLKDTLYFNSLKALQAKFAESTRVTEIGYRIATWYLVKAAQYKPLEGEAYKWHKKLAKETAQEAIKKFPDSYGAKQCQNMIESIETKQFNLVLEEANEPNKPFRALITSASIGKVYFRIVKTTHQELRQLARTEWGEKLFAKYNALPAVKNFEQVLTDDKDYQLHATEIKLPELGYGYYVVLTSLTPEFKYTNNLSSFATCVVTDIADIERRVDEKGIYDFYAVHRQTGEPLKNITAQVWYEKYNYVSRDYEIKKGETLKSDEKGYFALTKADNDRSFYVELINGADSYFNNNNYYLYKPYPNDYINVHTHIFTDRAIYRPGQTVYYKAIVLENKPKEAAKIKTNYPVTMTFYDVNSQKIASQQLTTNEYGTVSGSFIAPQGVLTGQMSISDGRGYAYVSVEEYKRPKFETSFNDVKGSYKLNEEVTVTGKAKAYAGNAIDGAKIAYRVVRRIQYPYWRWWYYMPPAYGTGDAEIANGELMSNDTGAYVIKFKALPDASVSKTSQATYIYDVMADVTDINGETHSTQTSVTVGYQALALSISNDEVINQQKPESIQISSTNLNGVAEPAKGNFAIYKLKQNERPFRNRLWAQPDRHSLSKEEYYKTFPVDQYADELNKYKWEKGAKVLDKTFDTGSKTKYDLAAELKKLEPGVYMIEAICKDKFGEEVKAFNYITLYNPENTALPEQEAEWFYMPKKQGEPGDKLSFVLASAFANTNYLYELETQGKIAQSALKATSTTPIEFTLEEQHRGNIAIHTTFVRHNRAYIRSSVVTVPYTNKELDIQFETFRNKLLPGQAEEWKLVLKDKKGEKAAAELMAGMYDASLDAFKANNWYLNIYDSYYSALNWGSNAGRQNNSTEFYNLSSKYTAIPNRAYDMLNYFGLNFYNYRFRGGFVSEMTMNASVAEEKAGDEVTLATKKIPASPTTAAPRREAAMKNKAAENKPKEDGDNESYTRSTGDQSGLKGGSEQQNGLSDVKARSNFNETAFFFPQLQTNEKGEVIIKFTVPESLTKWKVMGLAHTKDLKLGQFEKEVVTQKDLMVQPNAPRFFRENDKMTFISKIANLSENTLSGNSQLIFTNPLTGQDITKQICTSSPIVSFSSSKGQTASVSWELSIPEGISAISYKIVAKAGNFSDGEEMALPVLTNRMLVTESMPLPIRGNQTKDFSFGKFISQNNNSTTLKNHSYTLEFTANPAWYAVQALPYLIEYPYECIEQTFSRYYANSLASHVVNSKPKIKAVFDAWKTSSPDAFLSNLEKNQELKSAVLEETPWVLQSQNESENKKRVALLFDLNRMGNEQARALKKVMQAQSTNGGFSWFEGGPDDWYMTQHIICGFAHLDKLGVIKVRENGEVWNMLSKAVVYCDNRMREEYELTKKYNKDYKTTDHLSYMAVHYLYMRSFYKDLVLSNNNKECFNYYIAQERSYWTGQGRYMQGMLALSLYRQGDPKTSKDVLRSLKETSISNEEMGMYWKESYGYYWYEAPIEMQALMIEAFDEINGDLQSVDDLKTWLIKSKQTQHWGSTRSTTEAVYALLLKGSDWLATEPNVTIQVGDIKLDPKTDASLKAEPGTGYFKKTWTGSDIKPSMGKIKVEKKDQGVSWGGVYWQYFEQLDKITPAATPLSIKKQLFVQKNTAAGPVLEPISSSTALKLGDRVKVRIELRVDRDMDYVHMKDMRAAGFEPVNVLSSYKWQDGLGYYESTKDASTSFFFSRLTKGTHVFEYTLFVSQYGDFSNGVTTIQCMYAPEFTSHSEGIRVNVRK